MAFPPKPPFPPKPSAKQWAGGGPPKPPPGPPGAPPPGAPKPPPPPGQQPQDPNAPPAQPPGPNVAPDGKTPPPPMAKVPGEDPQMIARAHQAIGRLVMEGGLPKDVIDMLAKANSRLVETQHGPMGDDGSQQATDPNADPAASKPPFPPKAGDPAASGASKAPPPGGKPPFPPKPGAPPAPPKKPGAPSFPPK